jgi:hypothetical protein
MSNRSYVYFRETYIDREKQLFAYISRHTDTPPPTFKATKKNVRVGRFQSFVAFRPAAGSNGTRCEFLFLSVDDPKANIPSSLYNWIVKKVIPSFMK